MKPFRVAILGLSYHGRMLENQLNTYVGDQVFAQYIAESHWPAARHADFIHLISTPLASLRKIRAYGKPMIYHWVGSDVQRMISNRGVKQWAKKRLVQTGRETHFTVFAPLQESLGRMGIETDIFPLVNAHFPEQLPPLPALPAVLAYIPDERWEFYGGEAIVALARQFPEIHFHIVASERQVALPNVTAHGFVTDLSDLYARTTVLIRLTAHDGLSKMVVEALSYGRAVIWSQPFPNVYQASTVSQSAEKLKTIVAASQPNLDGRQYVREHLHPAKLAERYVDICRHISGRE